MVIEKVHAREILDSRGNPTVEVEVTLCNGVVRPRKCTLWRINRRKRGSGTARRRQGPLLG